jgi:hypothetical protein
LKKFWFLLFLLILIPDLRHSQLQFSTTIIDGDLPNIVAPASDYKIVLDNPFGIKALKGGELYPATNRFTAHFVMKTYFDLVPLFFQYWYNPIDSLYHSVTLAKLIMYIGVMFVLAWYVRVAIGLFWRFQLPIMATITPFLIVGGKYSDFFSFLDYSITYSFFYTLPVLVLLVFAMPYFLLWKKGEVEKSQGTSSFLNKSVLSIGALIVIPFLSLFGPLVAPLMVLIVVLFILKFFFGNFKWSFNSMLIQFKKLSKFWSFIGVYILLCAGYSIYLGKFNSENNWCEWTLSNRFERLIKGVKTTFFSIDEIGLFLLIIILFFLLLLWKFEMERRRLTLGYFFLISFFVAFYCFLIPLGGCRSYRPEMLRSDVSLPIILTFVAYINFMFWRLMLLFTKEKNYLLIGITISAMVILSAHLFDKDDLPEWGNGNEKQAIWFLRKASEKSIENDCVVLPMKTTVLSWSPSQYCQHTTNVANYLYQIKVLKRPILFRVQEYSAEH